MCVCVCIVWRFDAKLGVADHGVAEKEASNGCLVLQGPWKISLFLLVYKPTIKMIESMKEGTIYAIKLCNGWVRILGRWELNTTV